MYHPWDNSTIFYQQDKEGGINPHFEAAEAGNPLCPVCGVRKSKRRNLTLLFSLKIFF